MEKEKVGPTSHPDKYRTKEVSHMDVLKESSSLILHTTCPYGIGCNSQLVDHTRNFTCNKDNTLGPATFSLRVQCQVGQATPEICHVMRKSSRNKKERCFFFS